jgi:hypothetical protein
MTRVDGTGAGQAAAFNLGFAHTTGAVVMFLDADDLLHPHAIETVLACWGGDLCQLTFALETVDAEGRRNGLYDLSLLAHEGDNRPRLLRYGALGGGFAFAPTSGNVFSRAALDVILPMPEGPWPICADAYLVRAAALHGRTRALRQVLGAYRIHGANNYARADSLDRWNLSRGLRDLKIKALALETLATEPVSACDAQAVGLLRISLILRALQLRGAVALWDRNAAAFRKHARRAAAQVVRAEASAAMRAAALGTILRYASRIGRAGPFVELDWNTPPQMPIPAPLARALAPFEVPRFPCEAPLGQQVTFGGRGWGQILLSHGWSDLSHEEGVQSRGQEAGLRFVIGPAAGPIRLRFCLGVERDGNRDARSLTISVDGTRSWSGRVGERSEIEIGLDREPEALGQVVSVGFVLEGTRRGFRRAPPRGRSGGGSAPPRDR